MLELVVTRGLYISTHASIKCTLFISYHIKSIYRKKCAKMQKLLKILLNI